MGFGGGFLGGKKFAGNPDSYIPPTHEEFDFPTMADAEIAAIDVPGVLAEDSFLFLWTVMNRLPIAFSILDGWGAKYMFTMVWHKPNGPRPVGYPAYNSEFCLVGKRGRPKFATTKGFYTANNWDQTRIFGEPARGAWGRQVRACEKPASFYDLLCGVTPAPRLDMFARRQIEGFTAWGNEVGS